MTRDGSLNAPAVADHTRLVTSSYLVGKAGFEPPASASRTLRANQAALLPVTAAPC